MSSISYAVESECGGYLAGPENAKHGLVVIQEFWGMNNFIKSVADRAGKEGFRALVPDLYHGKVGTTREEASQLKAALVWVQAIRDIAGAARHLQKLGCQKIGVIGFCMGGSFSLASAIDIPIFNVAACFYGMPDLQKYDLSTIKIPVMAHFGNKDKNKNTDIEAANRLEEILKKTGVPLSFNKHDADHAFMNPTRDGYSQELADKVWVQTIAFLNEYLST